MNIALLNTRITIQKTTIVADSIGNRKNEWSDYYSCAATLGSESGSELDRTSETVENKSLAFTVRYSTEVKDLTPTNYRVIYNDEVYNISYIDHQNLKKKSLKIWCQKARR